MSNSNEATGSATARQVLTKEAYLAHKAAWPDSCELNFGMTEEEFKRFEASLDSPPEGQQK